MNMGIDPASCEDKVRARDGVGCEPDLETGRDAIHRLRIARLANRADAPILDTDVGLHYAKHRVDDGHVGDHQIGRAACARHLVVHAHAFAHALAAAEDELVAIAAQIALNFDEQARIPQSDAITGRRTE